MAKWIWEPRREENRAERGLPERDDPHHPGGTGRLQLLESLG